MNSTPSGTIQPVQGRSESEMIGLAPIMTMACNGVDLTPLGQQLMERANRSSGVVRANALMDIAIILQMKGNAQLALAMQEHALEFSRVYRVPARRNPDVRLLTLMCPGGVGANTPLEFLVEDSDIDLSMLYLSREKPLPDRIPEHDVLFVGVGHCEDHLNILKWIEDLTQGWPRRVLNRPDRISRLSRDTVSEMLQSVPGAYIPQTTKMSRMALERAAGNGDPLHFPLILRPLDSHAGIGLAKADTCADVLEYLSVTAGEQFYLAPFIDYRSADGQFRKYRVVFVDGRPYAGHMATSGHWIIHYLSGGMDSSSAKRAEEARFIADFENDFACRHQQALEAIPERLGLDYLVMDCAETIDGRLLIFEVDNNAVIHAMDAPDIFPYKKPQLGKISSAFRAMLLNTPRK